MVSIDAIVAVSQAAADMVSDQELHYSDVQHKFDEPVQVQIDAYLTKVKEVAQLGKNVSALVARHATAAVHSVTITAPGAIQVSSARAPLPGEVVHTPAPVQGWQGSGPLGPVSNAPGPGITSATGVATHTGMTAADVTSGSPMHVSVATDDVTKPAQTGMAGLVNAENEAKAPMNVSSTPPKK